MALFLAKNQLTFWIIFYNFKNLAVALRNATLPYVQDCTTIAIPDEVTENELICYLILKEQKPIKNIQADLTKILLEYQIPKKFFLTDHLPTNTSGKVSKITLKEQYLKTLFEDK